MPDPAGAVRVVLGGTGSLGSAIARRLARPDETLVLGHLENHERAARLAAELRPLAREVHLVAGNLAEPPARERLAELVGRLGGRCDSLVHAVALTSFKPLSRVRPAQWDLILGVSARSFLDVVSALVEPLAAARGTVVALSSQGSVRFLPGYGALGPAKAALEATVRQLACELGPRGIRVNAVRAGLVRSEVLERFPPGFEQAVTARTPLGRIGTPEEIAAVVGFLLGADAGWIVGQVLEVDGGFSLT